MKISSIMARAQWRNKRAILRDLAKVTQGDVPVSINENITDDRPPALNISEETEEEYLRLYSGDGSSDATFTEGPDLHMIKDMISMMQSVNSDSKEEESQGSAFEISKITPQSSTPLSHDKSSTSSIISGNRISQTEAEELSSELSTKIKQQPKTAKAKRERNVAIASLLKVYAGIAPVGHVVPNGEGSPKNSNVKSPVKLLKPEDFTYAPLEQQTNTATLLEQHTNTATLLEQHTNTATLLEQQTDTAKCVTYTEKVDNWLDQAKPIPMKGPVLSADAFRFRKIKTKPVEKPIPSKVASHRPQASGYGQYVPSPYAAELYQTILQQKEDKEAAQKLREDIWQRAEREMKELEAKKSQEERIDEEISAVVASLRGVVGSPETVTVRLNNGEEKQFPAIICLPQHRHQLTGPCKVCESLTSLRTHKERDLGNREPAEESLDEVTTMIHSTSLTTTMVQQSTEDVDDAFMLKLDESTIQLPNEKFKGTIAAKEMLAEEKSIQNTNGFSDWTSKQIATENIVKPPTKEASQAKEKSDKASQLTGTSVPDFWEDLLMDPPEGKIEKVPMDL